jgi:hypothetical protein
MLDVCGMPWTRAQPYVRAVFPGDARAPDDHAGVLELNVFDGDVPARPGLLILLTPASITRSA